MKTILLQNIGYAVALAVMLLSCSKDDDRIEDPIEEETPTSIYISGYSNEITNMGEVIWKNGIPLKVYDPSLLPSGNVRYAGAVYDLDIVNDDVYAVWKMSYKPTSSFYTTANIYSWRNDVNTVIKENDYNINPIAVDVHGQDIYFAGHYMDQYELPSVWKNGNREQLPGGIGSVTDLLVNNTDVLTVGYLQSCQSSTAAFWKNGALTKLAEGVEFNAYGIAKIGNDTYVAGGGKVNGVNGQRSALLWKNTTQQVLENPGGNIGASANAVALTDSKVYVAGYTYSQQSNSESMRATVWTNGAPAIISQSESEALSVAVKGNTVYVCGYEKAADRFIAVMWKMKDGNIETVKLSSGTADAKAYSIKVK